MNISIVDDAHTARTSIEAAHQRARYLYTMGVQSVIELCVGPSLGTLEAAYSFHGIPTIVGNDIDGRWEKYYPDATWIIGDCFNINYAPYGAVVFAPPLSRGCTGTRSDSLQINQVFPKYKDFLYLNSLRGRVAVCVLPGRSNATKSDRTQLHEFLSQCWSLQPKSVCVVPLQVGRRQVTKYWDVYVDLR